MQCLIPSPRQHRLCRRRLHVAGRCTHTYLPTYLLDQPPPLLLLPPLTLPQLTCLACLLWLENSIALGILPRPILRRYAEKLLAFFVPLTIGRRAALRRSFFKDFLFTHHYCCCCCCCTKLVNRCITLGPDHLAKNFFLSFLIWPIFNSVGTCSLQLPLRLGPPSTGYF